MTGIQTFCPKNKIEWSLIQLKSKYVCVVANVESGLELSQLNSSPKFEARVESLNSSLKLGANVESSEKLIIRVDLLLVSWLR